VALSSTTWTTFPYASSTHGDCLSTPCNLLRLCVTSTLITDLLLAETVMSESSSRTRTPAPSIHPEKKEKTSATEVSGSPHAAISTYSSVARTTRAQRRSWWRSFHIGNGILRDIRARAPYYLSDWKDAWNYRVIPAIVLIFFAKCVAISLHFVLC
jgi:hypothetical protein